jgi:hypothetical protein
VKRIGTRISAHSPQTSAANAVPLEQRRALIFSWIGSRSDDRGNKRSRGRRGHFQPFWRFLDIHDGFNSDSTTVAASDAGHQLRALMPKAVANRIGVNRMLTRRLGRWMGPVIDGRLRHSLAFPTSPAAPTRAQKPLGSIDHFFASGSLSRACKPRNSFRPSEKVTFLPTARVERSLA